MVTNNTEVCLCVCFCCYEFACKHWLHVSHCSPRRPLQGNRDNDYEEIQISSRNQQADSRDVQSVYAADNQLHYSSIVCQRDSVTVSTDGDVLPDVTTTGSLACDYSCINSTTYPPTAKKTVSSAAETPGEP